MNDEIKEILDRLKDDRQMVSYCYYRIFKDDRDKLLDYITNLQKERNMFKNSFEEMCKNYFEEQAKIKNINK